MWASGSHAVCMGGVWVGAGIWGCAHEVGMASTPASQYCCCCCCRLGLVMGEAAAGGGAAAVSRTAALSLSPAVSLLTAPAFLLLAANRVACFLWLDTVGGACRDGGQTFEFHSAPTTPYRLAHARTLTTSAPKPVSSSAGLDTARAGSWESYLVLGPAKQLQSTIFCCETDLLGVLSRPVSSSDRSQRI